MTFTEMKCHRTNYRNVIISMSSALHILEASINIVGWGKETDECGYERHGYFRYLQL